MQGKCELVHNRPLASSGNSRGMKGLFGFSRLDFAMAIGWVAFVLWMVQLGPFG